MDDGLLGMGSDAQSAVCGRTNGGAVAGSGSRGAGASHEAAQGQRADDLHLAQAVRRLGNDDVGRTTQLKFKSGRLKKLAAERELQIGGTRQIAARIVDAQARRAAVARTTTRGVS